MSIELTPTFLLKLEDRLDTIVEQYYTDLSSRLWWSKITKVRTSQSNRELIAFFIATASIADRGLTGEKVDYDAMAMLYTTFQNEFNGKGLKVQRSQIEDLDGHGVEMATQWATDMAGEMALWPQKQVTAILQNGDSSAVVGYDGVNFFSKSHPNNPLDPSSTIYANLFSGGVSGAYPGACPIDESVPVVTALENLKKVYAYMASIRLPNGVTPRGLRPAFLVVPPALYPRAVELTKAKFLAEAVGNGGG